MSSSVATAAAAVVVGVPPSLAVRRRAGPLCLCPPPLSCSHRAPSQTPARPDRSPCPPVHPSHRFPSAQPKHSHSDFSMDFILGKKTRLAAASLSAASLPSKATSAAASSPTWTEFCSLPASGGGRGLFLVPSLSCRPYYRCVAHLQRMPGLYHSRAPLGASCPGTLKKVRRKVRSVFSNKQLSGLEKVFLDKKYLSVPDRLKLAKELHLSDTQVKTWFQNRRMKEKKDAPLL